MAKEVIAGAVGGLIGAGLMKITAPPPPQIDPQIEASYVVYTDGSKYYAKNGDTEKIEFVDSDISNLLQNVINTLYQKYKGGRIFIKRGTYYPTRAIHIPDGINLVIEGEGDQTLFKYTAEFPLFEHQGIGIPTNPTWTSVIILRNFKVDRRGSGTNRGGMNLSFAKFAMYENIEWIDDWRDVDGDCAMYGVNNLIAIARNNRVFNKSYGIYFGGYITRLEANYVRNTAKVGIASTAVIPDLPTPADGPTHVIVVVENNLCVDCGRTDEALGVDVGAPTSTTQPGLAVIRGNVIISKDYTVKGAVAGIRVSNIIIENNLIAGNIEEIIFGLFAPDDGMIVIRNNRVKATAKQLLGAWFTFDTLIFENNIIDITITDARRAINTGNYKKAIIKSNKLNINYNVNQNIDSVIWLSSSSTIVEDNEINVRFPTGYTAGAIITGDLPAHVRGNKIIGTANFVLSIGTAQEDNQLVFRDNFVKNVGNLFALNIYHTVDIYITVRNNTLINMWPALGIGVTKPSNIYLDVEGIVLPTPPADVSMYMLRRNSGVATIPAGTTRVTVNHRIAGLPSKVLVTPLGTPPGKLWVENIGTTSFDIVTDVAPATDLPVAWIAEV